MYELNGAGHMAGMWVWWLIAIVVIAALGWGIVQSASRNAGRTAESAEDVLKRRYAAGEIDKEEYERRLQDLRQ